MSGDYADCALALFISLPLAAHDSPYPLSIRLYKPESKAVKKGQNAGVATIGRSAAMASYSSAQPSMATAAL